MRQFGLIGYPLSQSFSQKFFTKKFEKELLKDCRYDTFSIPSIDDLPAVLKRNPELCGLNVTIPYKEQVLSYLHEKTDLVKKIKACNCIKIKEGKLIGHNTDAPAFEQSLKEKLKPHHTKALILGTGGAAKAVEYSLQQLNILYHYVSRKPSAQSFSYEQLTPSLMQEYTLIINCTPLGMYPNIVEAPQIPYHALSDKHYLFDLIYNPEKTLFLQKGEEQGAAIKNGYEMLVLQAEESWRIWNDQ
ncbi:shikimate dehydrogenase family protein [Terrimonas pollutisoli]|uniref:shikimate dehydrogenase family protein n=1 Tax=Terrimonas pollutisoli TaxID=3034147 RepID=UPI0023EDDF16|nr:shikimate dehydrogenase [Terrimonas sp. H1YJ31]